MKVTIEVSDGLVGGVVDNAFESGVISYWIEEARRVNEAVEGAQDNLSDSEFLRAGGTIRFTTEDDGFGTTHDLTWAKVEKAMTLLNETLPRIVYDIVHENYDANTSDVLVQFALFGTEVYG